MSGICGQLGAGGQLFVQQDPVNATLPADASLGCSSGYFPLQSGVFPPLTFDQGGAVAAAIVGVWLIGWGAKQVKRAMEI